MTSICYCLLWCVSYVLIFYTEFVPRFQKSLQSMIVFDTIINALHKTTIKMYFRTFSNNGLLLYNGRVEKDFISLGLTNGYIFFQFDLGSGIGKIKSSQQIQLNKWVSIEAGRDGSVGYLQIDKEKKIFSILF